MMGESDYDSDGSQRLASENGQDVSEPPSADCTICFEAWTTVGKHRVVSLKCGHIFGKSCIEKWIGKAAHAKCPQCNDSVYKRDIRKLFTPHIVAVDNTDKEQWAKEMEKMKRELDRERMEKLKALDVAMTEKVEKLSIINQYQELLTKYEQLVAEKQNLGSSSNPASLLNVLQQELPKSLISSFKYHKSLMVSNEPNSCRTLAYDCHSDVLVMSKSTASGNRHGVLKLSLLDLQTAEYFQMHNAAVKQIRCSPFSDGLILTAGSDCTLKLSNLHSKSVLISYLVDFPVWSCAFHPADKNYIFAGMSNGHILVFDIRNTHLPIHQTTLAFSPKKLPIHSILFDCADGQDGLFAASLDSIGFIPFIDKSGLDCASSLRSEFGQLGQCTSLTRASNGYYLASYRQVPSNLPTNHYVFKPDDINTSLYHIVTDSGQKTLARSTIFSIHDQTIAAIPNENNASFSIRFVNSSMMPTQELRTHIAPVLDIVHCDAKNGNIIAALTDSEVFLYKAL